MFGKLKEKLKGWVKKNEDKTAVEQVEEFNDKKRKKKLKKAKLKEKEEKKALKLKEREEKLKEKEEKKALKLKEKEEKKAAKIKEKEEKKAGKESEDISKKPKEKVIEKTAKGKVIETIEAPIEETEEEKVIEKLDFEEEKIIITKKEKGPTKKEVEKETPEEVIEEKIEKKGFFAKFRKELTEEKFEELFEELEMILLQNNVAYRAVEAIKKSLGEKLIGKNLKDVNLGTELKLSIEELLINPPDFLEEVKKGIREKKPFVILFCGINGSGKTTTIAKVTDYLLKHDMKVCLAAADTFRAAAVEQIQQHADNLNVPLIKKDYGSDPAAVGFDAVSYAKKNNMDVVMIDTAGRMQNKDSLMKEIEKIVRVTKPDMRIFLGESITGNDATEQAKSFNESVDLTGIILSKADVDEKGGTAISVSHATGKPILFLGTGQNYSDLEVFDKEKLIEKLGL